MRKLVLFILSLSVLLSGYYRGKYADDKLSVTVKVTESVDNGAQVTEKSIDYGYTTYCAKDENGKKIYFNYPQKIDNTDNTEQINSLVREYVKEELQKISNGIFNGDMMSEPVNGDIYDSGRTESVSMQIDYTVTRDDEQYFSITFDGLIVYKQAAYPTHYFSSIIINAEDPGFVNYSDLYESDSNITKLFKSRCEEQLKSFTSDESAIEHISHYFDKEDVLENSENCFLTDNEFGISVPIIHVLGDHFEVLVDLEELENVRKN